VLNSTVPFRSYHSLLFKFWTLRIFEPPEPLWGLRDNVRCSSRAHWKTRSGLPISVNWTFFARCYGWGATSEYRFKIGHFAPAGAGWPKISGSVAPTNHFFLRKLLNGVSHGVKIWTDFSSALSQSTRLTDRQTDGRTPFSRLDRPWIQCSTVKMNRPI